MKKIQRICLFDIDGTLTKPRNQIQNTMIECLRSLKKVVDIGFVGGSDQSKIRGQLNEESIALSNYFFSQNGLVAYKQGSLIGKKSIKDHLGQQRLKKLINYCLHYIADLNIPIKRGTFIQYRTGLINISPIGRNCSQEERDEFQQYDHQHQIRKQFIQLLANEFADYNLKYSIGGQISFDVFPMGWDKTYCLQFLQQYEQIYFFGDKTFEGGNDYQIYQYLKSKGRAYSVKQGGPQTTIKLLNELFIKP